MKIVYLDIDGVLANFNKAAFRALGLEYKPDHPVLKEWHWYKYFGLTFDQLNEVCTSDFWVNLEWTPDGQEILHLVEDNFDNIYLLTTPMPNYQSYDGKIKWVKANLPRYFRKTIITMAPKHLLAKPNTLLIDDKDSNCEEFNEAGGSAILVPRSWNMSWMYNTLDIVTMAMERIKSNV